MFGLFKKKSKVDQLNEQYHKLMEESYRLSHTDRKASDLRRSEAEVLLKEIEQLQMQEGK